MGFTQRIRLDERLAFNRALLRKQFGPAIDIAHSSGIEDVAIGQLELALAGVPATEFIAPTECEIVEFDQQEIGDRYDGGRLS